MKHQHLFFVLFMAVPVMLHAQSSGGTARYVGIDAGLAMRWHNASVQTCHEADCTPFTEGSGVDFAAGIRVLYPLTEGLYLRTAASWKQVNGDFSTERKHYPILGQSNAVEYVDLQDELETSLSIVQIDLGVAYSLFESGVYLSCSPVLILPLSATWKQTETITVPHNVYYVNGSSSKVLLDGDIPNIKSFVGLRLGGGALLPLGETLVFSPELTYMLPLGDLQSDFAWSMSGIDLSLGVMFRL
jgi:hypothetical protein